MDSVSVSRQLHESWIHYRNGMNENKWLHSVGLVIPTWCDSCELHYWCVRRKATWRFVPKQFTSMIVNIGTQRAIFENRRRLQDVDAYSLNVWYLCPPSPNLKIIHTYRLAPPLQFSGSVSDFPFEGGRNSGKLGNQKGRMILSAPLAS